MGSQDKTTEQTSDYDFWDELPDIVRVAINQAKDELDRGEGSPHDEVMARMKKRFLNEL